MHLLLFNRVLILTAVVEACILIDPSKASYTWQFIVQSRYRLCTKIRLRVARDNDDPLDKLARSKETEVHEAFLNLANTSVVIVPG